MSESAADALKARIDVIEESYELWLAYAAKGVNAMTASKSDTMVRDTLQKTAGALPELAELFLALAEDRGVSNAERYHSFIELLRRDAADALAAIQIVLAQSAITSQMVDNLNAMIHLRALLTDVFLIDEILRPDAEPPPRSTAS